MILNTEEVVTKIEEGKKLSIIRIGDGEAIVLNGLNDTDAFAMVLKRQLGYYPPLNECIEIRNNLIQACERADILGVPMQKNLADLNFYWRHAEELVKSNTNTLTPVRCSININYDLLEGNYLHDILKGRSVLNYISCRNLDEEFKTAFRIKQVNSFIIAPEMKFTSGYVGDKHYPTQYNRIQRWLDKCEIEGQVCLVGAGVIGKNYCNWFRDRGGIGIDIGSCFDELAGYVTRGQERGLNVKANTKFKL